MQVTFLPMNKTAVAKDGDNLLAIARSLGIDLNAVCSGYGSCKKCKVIISKGNNKQLTKLEEETFTKEEIEAGLRLACQYGINSDTSVLISNPYIGTVSFNKIKSHIQTSKKRLGVAFDLGTTSVAASLWDLDKKIKLGYASCDNKQRAYGADVISRITYGVESQENLRRLQELILLSCNTLIQELLLQSQEENDAILELVAVGNTTMSHIFVGEGLERLAKAPIRPVFMEGRTQNAQQLGLQLNPTASITILPNIGGHVGSDTLACILATKIQESAKTSLIIDVGTNGEIALSNQGRMLACSTAAGPAFEGANISQGMRAIPGAISEVVIAGEKIRLKVIGNVEPIGICGSGIIDAVAAFRINDFMDYTGRIVTKNRVESETGNPIFVLAENKDNTQVIITQKDIREVQLAKAAIHAGILVLLSQSNLSLKELDHIYLAGAFGSHINIKNAITIGLLPNIDPLKIKYIGNAALIGAEQVLTNKIDLDTVKAIATKVEHVDLAMQESFKEQYINSMNF